MKNFACQYVVVRFSPFVETGEFANVGILMMAPRKRFFAFELQTRRYKRVTHFFDDLDPGLYRAALHQVKEELERVRGLLMEHGFDRRRKEVDTDFAKHVFHEVVRPRESIIRFSEPRVVLTDDPKKKIQDLYKFYVERNFVTKEYQEAVLERGVRKLLTSANLQDRFHQKKIGDEEFNANFPFVEEVKGRAVKIIKPLNLAQDRPSQILEHEALWQFRLSELKNKKLLPDRILFAVGGPEESHEDARHDAFYKAMDRLRKFGVETAKINDERKVIDFARAN
ncbi:DUF3037 domain-containing protein [Guyparkeria halophila]|uniref:DUF3037 domain-containing protein n=1 Tax=Guyparkeria halophila TaxID=47960 RepID=A0ABZ0YXU8_9GAMM|nr:DUF3037 domain-containing protein [Guyparkeria halophila]WQH17005.1 DUF3037 domain-containing protein [Guyparkeria halophila]